MPQKTDTLYTYYRIDITPGAESWDYTIVETLDEVRDYLQLLEIHLDDDTMQFEVKITGVGMTKTQFADWLEESIKNFDK